MKRAFFAVAMLLAASAAHAQLYLAPGIARLSAQEGHNNPTVAIGYTFSKHIAVELGYIDKGLMAERVLSQSRTALGGDVFRYESTTEREEAEALRLTGKLTLPLSEHFSLFGTASAYRVKVGNTNTLQSRDQKEVGASVTPISGFSAVSTSTRTEILPALGIGAKLNMGSFFSLTAAVERINMKEGMLRDTDHVRVTTIGAEFRF